MAGREAVQHADSDGEWRVGSRDSVRVRGSGWALQVLSVVYRDVHVSPPVHRPHFTSSTRMTNYKLGLMC